MKTRTIFQAKKQLVFCVLFLFSQILIGQVSLYSHPTNLTPAESEALNNLVEDYTVYTLNPIEIYNSLQTEEIVELNLNLNEEINTTFQLQENDLRPKGYFLTQKSEENEFLFGKGKEKIFRGITNNEISQPAYIYSTEIFFTAYFSINKEAYRLEPIESIIGFSTLQNTYILYKESDLHTFSNITGGCLTEIPIEEHSGGGGGSCETAPVCATYPILELDGVKRYLEVAVDVDVKFFNKYKNRFPKLSPVRSVEKVVMDHLSSVDAIYQRYFDLQVKLVYLNIWEHSVAPPIGNYPYSGSSIVSLWGQARTYWNDTTRRCVHRDLMIVLSANLESACGFVHNILGRGSLCNANFNTNSTHPFNAYATINDFGPSTSKTIAHEIGHLFGLGHLSTTSCEGQCMNNATATLMCPGLCGQGSDNFLKTSQCNIYSFLQANDCFEDCAPTIEEVPNIQGRESICLGENVVYEISIAPTGTVTWELGPNLVLTSGTLNSTSISVRATAFGDTYIQATFSHNCVAAAIRKHIQVSGYEIREIDPMCFDEDCAVFDRGGAYELFASCDNRAIAACWAFSRPDEFYPVASTQNPFCTPVFFPFPQNNLSNRFVTLYAYDINNPTNLLAQKNIFILDCPGPCVGDRNNSEDFDQDNDNRKNTFSSERFVFPNPADDLLTIDLPINEAALELSVLNIQGKIIMLKKIEPNQSTIQLSTSHWAQGSYYIQLKTAKTSYLQRLIIQH